MPVPAWWNPDIVYPTITPSPQVSFMESVNRMMPYISPLDQRRWATYLWSNAPTVFPYAPETLGDWRPPPVAAPPAAQRTQQAQQTLMGPEGTIDPDAPARQWLESIIGVAGEYAGPRTRGQQRQYEQRVGEMFANPMSYGVSQEEGAMWQPWIQSLVQPTTQHLSTRISPQAPEWMQAASIYGPKTTRFRGTKWANPRWF
jgi:hypothetical protein